MKTRDELLEDLRRDRPDVAVDASWDQDDNFVWDGDGPDPVENGQAAHDVTVTATTIREGKLLYGEAYLGGSYSEIGGPHCKDIHGYFPQMLEEALAELDGAIEARG